MLSTFRESRIIVRSLLTRQALHSTTAWNLQSLQTMRIELISRITG